MNKPHPSVRAALSALILLPALLYPTNFKTVARQGGPTRDLETVSIKVEDGKFVKLYEKSYALVIGASEYTAGWAKLPGVREDIKAVERALQRQGFQVTVETEPNAERLEKTFKDFIRLYGMEINNRLLLYFAGHGHTMRHASGEEMGYIVPVDAPRPDRDPVGFRVKALNMGQIERYALDIQSKHALFLFDSCFSGSLLGLSRSRAIPDSITYKTTEHVRQFIASGSADEKVPDASIFRRQFVEGIEGEADGNKDGYVTGMELGEFLQVKVINYSKNTQHPQYGKIRNPHLDKGDFVFALPKTMSSTPPPTPTPVDPAQELAFWNSIQNSADPEDFRDYLSRYPTGLYAGIARRKLTALTSAPPTRPSPARPTAGSVTRPRSGIELVYIPAGEFMMGAENGGADEKPVQRVTIRDGFWMGKYEVTQAQWTAVMGSNPSNFKGDNLPVESVSWDDAQQFIQKLNAQNDGFSYRLPTEAEWEYACRAGTTGDYAGQLDAMGWYYENAGDTRLKDSEWSYDKLKANNNRTHPVGSKQPNGFGLYDMHGNVWEWCEDWYHDSYAGASVDGSAWLSGGEQKYRVVRGGSWFFLASNLRSADRYFVGPGVRLNFYGFRVVAFARS